MAELLAGMVGLALRRIGHFGVGALLLLGGTLAPAQTVTYFHNDVSGTPVLATDAGGSAVWKENYRPYGERLNNPPAEAGNAIGFAGKPFDAGTGLSYMGARYYDPGVGRFMGVDAAPVDPGSVHGFNRYAYANNNPYKYVDPDGRSPIDAVLLVYDLGKLGVAVYNGAGVGAAAFDAALRSGAIKPSQVPIDYIVRDGRTIILNARSSQALEAAGVARSQWSAVNRTGNPAFEGRLADQLSRNPGGPFDTVRRAGGQ